MVQEIEKLYNLQFNEQKAKDEEVKIKETEEQPNIECKTQNDHRVFDSDIDKSFIEYNNVDSLLADQPMKQNSDSDTVEENRKKEFLSTIKTVDSENESDKNDQAETSQGVVSSTTSQPDNKGINVGNSISLETDEDKELLKLDKVDSSHLNAFEENKSEQNSSILEDLNTKNHNERAEKNEDLQSNSFQSIESDKIEAESMSQPNAENNLQMANEKDDTTDGIKPLSEEIKSKNDLNDSNEIIDPKKLTNDESKLTKISNEKINIETTEINQADRMAKENNLTEKENKFSPNFESDMKEKNKNESPSLDKKIIINGEVQQEGVHTEEQKIGENKAASHSNRDCKEIERNEEGQKENNNKEESLVNSEGQK